MTEPHPFVAEALILKDEMIRKVTTKFGRALLRGISSPMFLRRGVYLPTPRFHRSLQGDPTGSKQDYSAFWIYRGGDVQSVGTTVIEHRDDFYEPPTTSIIYERGEAGEWSVEFLHGHYRWERYMDPDDMRVLITLTALSIAVERPFEIPAEYLSS